MTDVKMDSCFRTALSVEQITSSGLFTYDADENAYCPKDCAFDLFDQNGYDLCPLEKLYAEAATGSPSERICWELIPKQERHVFDTTIDVPTMSSVYMISLEYAHLLHRKGFAGQAREQLLEFARRNSLVQKLLCIVPKWCVDIRFDGYRRTRKDDELFPQEILHYEFDSTVRTELMHVVERWTLFLGSKVMLRSMFLRLLQTQSVWESHTFEDRNRIKCSLVGLPQMSYRAVVWRLEQQNTTS